MSDAGETRARARIALHKEYIASKVMSVLVQSWGETDHSDLQANFRAFVVHSGDEDFSSCVFY